MEDEQLTKKEKRELAKEKKKEEKRKQEMTDKTKKSILWLLGLAIFAFLGWQVYQFFTAPLPEQAVAPIEVAESDHIKGNREAEAVLIEFADFQCPACKAYHPLVKQLGEERSEDVLIVFRHYPLVSIHPNAMPAALAAEAASRQDRFWEMHDLLFDRQDDWANASNVEDIFAGYAEELELDVEQYRQDYSSSEVADKVNADMLSGNQLGVNSTPTFYLNGRKLDNIRGYQDFLSAIDNVINQ